MQTNTENPPISMFLLRFPFIEAAVLVVVGFGLFFFPQIIRPQWAWDIAPFNTRLLGAIYLGAMVPVAHMFYSGRWSPTRLVLRAIFTFTFVVLVVSIYYLGRFDFSLPAVWAWFALYIGLPASGQYRRLAGSAESSCGVGHSHDHRRTARRLAPGR